MKLFTPTLLLSLCLNLSGFAQSKLPALTEGQSTRLEKHTVDPRKIVYSDDKGYLLMGVSDGDLALQRVNNDLSIGETTVIDNRTAAGDVLRFSGSQVMNNSLCLFWILEQGKTNKFTLYYQFANLTTGKEMTPKAILVISNTYSDEVLPGKFVESDYYNYFRTALSDDRKQLLLIFPNDSSGKVENQSYCIQVFDSLLHPLKQTTYTFPIKHNQYLLKDIKITNDGDIAFSGIETIDGSTVKGCSSMFPYMRPVGMFHLTLLQHDAVLIQDRTIRMDKKLVTDVAFNMGKQSIQVMGFWSDVVDYSNRTKMDIDRWYCKGSFFQNFDYATNDPTTTTNSTFSQQLINDCDIWVAPKPTDVKRRKVEVFALTAQKILVMKNGDFVLMSEQLTEYAPTSVYSGNIVACRYSANGNYKMTTNIARYEITSLPTPSYLYTQDYICYTSNESIFIIYSKTAQGVPYRLAEKHNEASMQPNIPESSIVLAEINPDGKLSRSVLKDVEGESFFKLIQSCSYVDTDKSTVFLAGTDFRNYWFLTAKYN